ncbi:hypothetical protein Aph01nite_01240 [Acrocarpospora phusangensis]|uniref:Uncharacterized protein n=1 Tax=Acrocarpospora phusangensis TaxID=1070424 RepID=A0A919UH99_9ACTN|nr:hypothetical protein [Acrocarpospora phusangensis]GIH21814.1 hypothetical protein Aph01nite_01240 [Acrocarpospora phusangensis]
MSANGLDALFTMKNPLGPIAISDRESLPVLRALYDTRVNLHLQSETSPPTFIVGRRGSGKTSLLLSREFDAQTLSVRLSAAGVFSRIQAAVRLIGDSMMLTVEGVAQIWEMLLWAPVITRLVVSQPPSPADPPRARQLLWDETAAIRHHLGDPATQDDDALDFATLRLIDHVKNGGTSISLENLRRGFRLGRRPWSEAVDVAGELIRARRTPVFVLIDSLEDIGGHIEPIQSCLQGLFHLVGGIGLRTGRTGFRVQCCFPSELWPALVHVAANPVKDFSGRMVLRWHWKDLVKAVGGRLHTFLRLHFPGELKGLPAADPEELVYRLLPPSLTSPTGRAEPTIAYLLRHTQLLPRQVLYVFNEALHRSIASTGRPYLRAEHLLATIAETEVTLCAEVFSAHRFRYPQAHAVARRLIPYLPFRFDDPYLHRMCNRAGIRAEFGLGYLEVREMFTDVGVIGRFQDETERYLRAEFAYAAEGQMVLSPDEEYCLHPLFVRRYNAKDVRSPQKGGKPVYPSGTPEGAP